MTRRLGFACTALLLLAACGRAGAPVAPERVTPVPPSQVSAVVDSGAIEVAFATPQRRADGTRLRDLTMLRVFRTEDDGAGEPKPAMLDRRRIAGYTEVAAVRPGEAAPDTTADGRLTVLDRRGLTPGRRYSYVVVADDARGHVSPPSERVSAFMIAAPAAPDGLQATPGDREVRLAWRPSQTMSDGSAATPGIVYQVLRAPAPDGELDVVTVTGAGATTFVDRGLDNERAYVYAIRALRTSRGTLARSEPSARATATPLDMTPPRPPTELVAVPSQGTVRLVWIGSPDPDAGRYIVYRGRNGGALERVGSTMAPGTTFTDRDVPAGQWRYAVSAQDSSSRANESARSAEVTVTVP
jgi:hypothetical protein